MDAKQVKERRKDGIEAVVHRLYDIRSCCIGINGLKLGWPTEFTPLLFGKNRFKFNRLIKVFRRD